MTTRQQIEEVVRRYGGPTPRSSLPAWLRSQPLGPEQFDLALAVALSSDDKYAGVTPTYDENDDLTGWKGLGLKSK